MKLRSIGAQAIRSRKRPHRRRLQHHELRFDAVDGGGCHDRFERRARAAGSPVPACGKRADVEVANQPLGVFQDVIQVAGDLAVLDQGASRSARADPRSGAPGRPTFRSPIPARRARPPISSRSRGSRSRAESRRRSINLRSRRAGCSRAAMRSPVIVLRTSRRNLTAVSRSLADTRSPPMPPCRTHPAWRSGLH